MLNEYFILYYFSYNHSTRGYVQNLTKSIMQSRAKRRELVYKIKNGKKIDALNIKYSIEYESNKKLLEEIPKNALNQLLENPLPKRLKDLNTWRGAYIPGQLIKEIDWYFLRIIKYKDEINNFLQLKDLFENYILQSKFDLCLDIITEVEKSVCLGMQNQYNWCPGYKFDILRSSQLFLYRRIAPQIIPCFDPGFFQILYGPFTI